MIKLLRVTTAHALGAFCGSVPAKPELQQWRSLIAAKKRRQRRCMSEAKRLERKKLHCYFLKGNTIETNWGQQFQKCMHLTKSFHSFIVN